MERMEVVAVSGEGAGSAALLALGAVSAWVSISRCKASVLA